MRECIGATTIARHVGDNPPNPRLTSRTRAHFHRLLLMSASVVALSALMPGSAAAQTWTGATSNNWTVGSNWNTGTAPAGGAVNIVPGSNVVLGVSPGATGTTSTLNVRDLVGGTTNLTI